MNLINGFKRLSVLACAILLALPFNSCTDIEPEVFSDLTPANFPTNRTEVLSAFSSCYTTLYNTGSHGGYMSTQHVAADDVMIPHRGSDWEDGGNWLRTHRHQNQATDPQLNGAWIDLYRGALFSNDVIRLINGTDLLEDSEKGQLVGELRVLRAFYYLRLIDAFGDVPLVTGDEEVVEAEPTSTPRAEVFNFIVTELQEASGSLSRDKLYGRINYYAAQALLSRVLLNAEVYSGTARYADAVAAADNVINGSAYSLADDYHANFSPNNGDGFNSATDELIWVIPYDEIQAGGFNILQMSYHYSSQQTFDLQDQPWNGYCSLQEFYESYDDTDKRKGEWGNQQVPGNFLAGPQFAVDGVTPIVDGTFDDPDGPEIVFTPEVNELAPGAFRQAGARIFKYPPRIGSPNTLNNDWSLVRYSEVLMNKAEALFRQNAGDAQALMLVNMVRERAGLDGFSSLTADDLLAERGREFFYEGMRRTDLIRFGRYGEAWFGKAASDPTKQLFPIPQPQLNANRNLTQNPGY